MTHYVVTCDVDRDVSTAYCSLGDPLSHGSPVVVVVVGKFPTLIWLF